MFKPICDHTLCVQEAGGLVNCLKMLKTEQKQSKHSLPFTLHQHPSTVNSRKSDLVDCRKCHSSHRNISGEHHIQRRRQRISIKYMKS